MSDNLTRRVQQLLSGLALLADGNTGSTERGVSASKPGTKEPKVDSLYLHYSRRLERIALIDYVPARNGQLLAAIEDGEQALRRERVRTLPEMTMAQKNWCILTYEMNKRSDRVAETYDVQVEHVERLRHDHAQTRRHGRERGAPQPGVEVRQASAAETRVQILALRESEPELSTRQIAARLGVSHMTVFRSVRTASQDVT